MIILEISFFATGISFLLLATETTRLDWPADAKLSEQISN